MGNPDASATSADTLREPINLQGVRKLARTRFLANNDWITIDVLTDTHA